MIPGNSFTLTLALDLCLGADGLVCDSLLLRRQTPKYVFF